MQITCLSISYHTTPVELRECFSLSTEAIETILADVPPLASHGGTFEALSELVVLSTCNRLEMYATVSLPAWMEENPESIFKPLVDYMRQALKISSPFEPYLRRYRGIRAAAHLFKVTAGLDSIAIGETQILGQVSRALETAMRLGSARHVLPSLFQTAVRIGKRVHTETFIDRRPNSISSVAVQLAEKQVGDLAAQKILVVGAGKIGGYTVESLREHGARCIFLANRTYQNAAEMVRRSGGTALPFSQLSRGLFESDLVFTATSAQQPVLHASQLEEVMAIRPERPLTLIDLAVPRNIEPRARDVPGVRLFDMDAIQAFVRQSAPGSSREIARAEAILAEETAEYERLLRILPFIGELHKKAEALRQREVERALGHLHNPSAEVVDQIEMLSKSLTRKILHEPTMHLRTEANRDTLRDYVNILSALFDLNHEEPIFSPEEEAQWER